MAAGKGSWFFLWMQCWGRGATYATADGPTPMSIPAALINHMRGRETGGGERNVERGRGREREKERQ